MYAWSTNDEFKFIESLIYGEKKEQDVLINAQERIARLENYCRGIKKRIKWDAIDKKEVKNHAEKMLKKLRSYG